MMERKKIIFENVKEICDHCLGRQFKGLYPKIDNEKIGAAIRKASTEAEVKKIIATDIDTYETNKCAICEGIFQRIDDIVELTLDKMKEYEFETFLVGTSVSKKLTDNEERLWEKIGAENVEPLKKELNRLIRRRLTQHTKKRINYEYPDIIFLADFIKQRIMAQLNSIFIEGRYQKLMRGIPQTKWPCMKCRGRGCDACKGTGREFEETIEEIIAAPFLEASKATKEKFHGQGREDLDALMLGDGRPFILEIIDPQIRTFDLKKVEKEINSKNKKKIKVSDLKFTARESVQEIKKKMFDKTYRCTIETEEKIDKKQLEDLEKFFENKEIIQKTPARVLGHRADKKRPRIIKKLKIKFIDSNHFEAEITAEAGTYIKELISGDGGRSVPSISQQLNLKCVCKELDVTKIHE